MSRKLFRSLLFVVIFFPALGQAQAASFEKEAGVKPRLLAFGEVIIRGSAGSGSGTRTLTVSTSQEVTYDSETLRTSTVSNKDAIPSSGLGIGNIAVGKTFTITWSSSGSAVCRIGSTSGVADFGPSMSKGGVMSSFQDTTPSGSKTVKFIPQASFGGEEVLYVITCGSGITNDNNGNAVMLDVPIFKPFPVNGGWSGWSSCSTSCDNGTQTRICNNPAPANGGTNCAGSVTQTCNLMPCDNGCASDTCTFDQCYNNSAFVGGKKKCIDNGCAVNTCKTGLCYNSFNYVSGTKPCDNGCAANTCNTETCDNSISIVQGTKVCIDNGCAGGTCTTDTCNNSFAIVKGTKICVDNGCAANTCTNATCDNSFTIVSGTKKCINGTCGTGRCSGFFCSFMPGPYTNWCVAGSPSSTTLGQASWTCRGSNGGTDIVCPNVPIDGVCGSTSSDVPVAIAPSASLCLVGTSSSVIGQGPWNWKCVGSGGGTTVDCRALKSVVVADNSCAADTCVATQCVNNLGDFVNGTKICNIDNGCAANTCTAAACNNGIEWVSGKKDCGNSNGNGSCTVAKTCASSNNGSLTTCDGQPGTKQAAFPVTGNCTSVGAEKICKSADCERTIVKQTQACLKIDASGCMNPVPCDVAKSCPSVMQVCPACSLEINPNGGTIEVTPQ